MVVAITSTASGALHQRRRAPYAQWTSFTPAVGEVLVDTTYWRTLVGDGASTSGGWAAAKATYTGIADSSYSILATDVVVAITSITATRTFTMPDAANYPVGQRLMIVDMSGSVSGVASLTINSFLAAQSMTLSSGTSTTVTMSTAYIGINFAASTAATWAGWV